MEYQLKSWEKVEDIYEIAKKYNYRSSRKYPSFQFCEKGAYEAAKRLGILDDVCKHMVDLNESWDFDSIVKRAKKYTKKHDFLKNDPRAYGAAVRFNILDYACHHMKESYKTWTPESLAVEAKKYDQKKRFEEGCPSAYHAASNRGILDEICAHMQRGSKGFDPKKPGTLYYLRVKGGVAYKVGITNLSVSQRFRSDMKYIDVIKTWYYPCGQDAIDEESAILKKYAEYKWNGEDLLLTGNTELFSIDILGLDTE